MIKRQNEGLLYRKVGLKDMWNFWPESWVNPFKNMQSFRYSKMSFLWTKKPPFDKTTSTNDKAKVSFTEKWPRKILGTDDQNHGLTRFKICQFFDYSNMSFIWTKSLLLTKQHDQTTNPRSLVQKSGLERYLELLTRILG